MILKLMQRPIFDRTVPHVRVLSHEGFEFMHIEFDATSRGAISEGFPVMNSLVTTREAQREDSLDAFPSLILGHDLAIILVLP